MGEVKIYLELSDEVQKVMTQRGISLDTILQREGINAEITYDENPLQSDKSPKTRELATIITVSAISAIPIAIAINKLFKKDLAIAKYYRLEPITDPKTGEVLRDKRGNPMMNKIPQFEISETRPKHIKEDFQIQGPLNLSISLKSETKELEA